MKKSSTTRYKNVLGISLFSFSDQHRKLCNHIPRSLTFYDHNIVLSSFYRTLSTSACRKTRSLSERASMLPDQNSLLVLLFDKFKNSILKLCWDHWAIFIKRYIYCQRLCQTCIGRKKQVRTL